MPMNSAQCMCTAHNKTTPTNLHFFSLHVQKETAGSMKYVINWCGLNLFDISTAGGRYLHAYVSTSTYDTLCIPVLYSVINLREQELASGTIKI